MLQSVFSHVASNHVKFFGTKESVYIRKELNSNSIGLLHKHGHGFNMAAVTSCDNVISGAFRVFMTGN